jgi:tetratricopeptide (TPR) repeat protein
LRYVESLSDARTKLADFFSILLEVWLSPSAQWYHTPCSHEEAGVDLDAFRQMVAKNPQGFLGRYGLGNKLVQEGGNLEEAVEHLTVATQLDPTHVASHLGLGRALVSLGRKDEAKPILQAGIDAARSGRSNGGVDLVPEMQALLRTLG